MKNKIDGNQAELLRAFWHEIWQKEFQKKKKCCKSYKDGKRCKKCPKA